MENYTFLEVVSIRQEVREREYAGSLNSPQLIAEFIQKEIGDLANEALYVVCLSSKMEVNAVHVVSVGDLSSTIVAPREVFKSSILNNSAFIIIAHNHPSQNLMPSQGDLDMTSKLVKSGQILGIQVLDHLIVSSNRHYSMREKHNYLFNSKGSTKW